MQPGKALKLVFSFGMVFCNCFRAGSVFRQPSDLVVGQVKGGPMSRTYLTSAIPAAINRLAILAFFIFCIACGLVAQEPEGAVIYLKQCANCHENSTTTRAPSPVALRLMSPQDILHALDSGRMKAQGALLNLKQRYIVSEYLAGSLLMQASQAPEPVLCPDVKAPFAPSGKDWNGWGAGLNNARFQPGDRAGLTADQVPHLALKWSFAFPYARLSWGQPTVVGGRVFVTSVNRFVYSLDASTGCQYWMYRLTRRCGLRSSL